MTTYCVVLVDSGGNVQYIGNLPSFDHARDVECIAKHGLTVSEYEEKCKEWEEKKVTYENQWKEQVPKYTLAAIVEKVNSSKRYSYYNLTEKDVFGCPINGVITIPNSQYYVTTYVRLAEDEFQQKCDSSFEQSLFWDEFKRDEKQKSITWSRVLAEPEKEFKGN